MVVMVTGGWRGAHWGMQAGACSRRSALLFFPSCTQQSSASVTPLVMYALCVLFAAPFTAAGAGQRVFFCLPPLCVFISTRTVLHRWPMNYRSGTALEHILAVQLQSSQQVCFVQCARQFRRGTLVHGALGVVSVHCLRYCTSQHPLVTALLHAGRCVWGRVAE